jgi:hypothetical protein
LNIIKQEYYQVKYLIIDAKESIDVSDFLYGNPFSHELVIAACDLSDTEYDRLKKKDPKKNTLTLGKNMPVIYLSAASLFVE